MKIYLEKNGRGMFSIHRKGLTINILKDNKSQLDSYKVSKFNRNYYKMKVYEKNNFKKFCRKHNLDYYEIYYLLNNEI